MAIMEISVTPVGAGTPSITDYVAAAAKLAVESGLEVTINAMGTVVTGDLEKLLILAGRMHRAVLSHGAKRVVTTIRIDDRVDKEMRQPDRIQAVSDLVGKAWP